MAITYRSVKGSALTHTELDANFTDLDGRATANAAAAVAATHPNRVLVTQANAATTLGGTIDSTVEYFVTEDINMAGIQIVVPTGGIYIRGYNFDISKLTNATINETMFYSLASGNVLMFDVGIESSGAGSQVYDLKSNTGFNAIEVTRVNYNNCVSLGELDNFRQGLEVGTGRFGGTPTLILTGVWVGGYKITTSITRSLTAGTYDLFTAGVGFTMSSRFYTDMNVDLPAGVGYCNFGPSNFPNPETMQMNGMIITRAGVVDHDDALYHPNTDPTDTHALFTDNYGVHDTYHSGHLTATATAATTIAVIGTAVELTAPTWTGTHIDHMSEISNGHLKNLSVTKISYRIAFDIEVSGTNADVLRLELWKRDDSAATDALVYSTTRVVNDAKSGADTCHFGSETITHLDTSDDLYLKIANETSTANVTVVVGSGFFVAAR